MTAATASPRQFSRRDMLRLLAGGSAGFLVAACRPPNPPPDATTLPTPAASAAAATTTPAAATATPPSPPPWQPPTTTRITPNEDFYTLKYNPEPPPDVDVASYRLEIMGVVDRPLSLSLAEIMAYPSVIQMRTLQCISNPVGGNLIGNAMWKGVRMKQLLADAGIQSPTHHLKLESLDGYDTGIPASLALDENALLVYEMNGDPLPAAHGFPLRCLWPGRYGQKQPKWLHRVTVQRTPHLGHWESQGWSDEARINPTAIIETPPENSTQSPDFYVGGIANATDVGLEGVEVSLDGGATWQQAELLRGPSSLVWTHWWVRVQGGNAGTYRILANTTDNAGNDQSLPGRANRLLGGAFPDGVDEMQQLTIRVIGAQG
ncbi:MAG: molybdopterin-dependent oxidoreductase [Anaerolineales bacterium]|nr:molybdopterin-dependent oxidoreductase [Anaerolineales bacterium]MCB8952379.1 molybdopterin-dependent oxidoreductase [Ardenticatenales bacterium]